jgi:uncharacterized membrane protein
LRICYLEGDKCSTKYLLGAFAAAGIEVEPEPRWRGCDAVMLSDYGAERLGVDAARALVRDVASGLGLVMVGGWRSFGRGGYARSPLAEALPVTMLDGDDRHASVAGCYPVPIGPHAILGALDWSRPPVLCGHNQLTPKPAAHVVLEAREAALTPEGPRVNVRGAPLLVAGGVGEGRVVAYAGDLAPHWSGGLTDWGESAVPGPEGEEMGTAYVAFVAQMVRWAARAAPQEPVRRA